MIEETWLLEYVPASGSLAIDVGSNVGDWSLLLSPRFGRTIAIEPDERALAARSSISNVQVIRAAAGKEPGVKTLYMRPQALQSSLLENRTIDDLPYVDEQGVDVVTLDEIAPIGADFVKIDVEGAEKDVLEGCLDWSRWSRTTFVVECHDTFSDVRDQLVRLGKRVTRVPHPIPGAHAGHCWAVGVPNDSDQPVV